MSDTVLVKGVEMRIPSEDALDIMWKRADTFAQESTEHLEYGDEKAAAARAAFVRDVYVSGLIDAATYLEVGAPRDPAPQVDPRVAPTEAVLRQLALDSAVRLDVGSNATAEATVSAANLFYGFLTGKAAE